MRFVHSLKDSDRGDRGLFVAVSIDEPLVSDARQTEKKIAI
jgi:hypothetical protein